MARYLYSELATLVQARRNCAEKMADGHSESVVANAMEWHDKHGARLYKLVANLMPSGSGFDAGTKLDEASSHADKLVFTTGFHHMNDAGMYDGWTEHVVTVTPSMLHRFHIRVSGRNRNDIKDYIMETFAFALEHELSDVDAGAAAPAA